MIGANDVTHRIDKSVAVRHLADAVRRLRELGTEVVVGTCPDLGTIQPIPQPLRLIGRRWSRDLAAAQTVAVVEAGGRTVSLGDLLGPEFAERPHEMFSADRFHPSPAGYARAAAALLPSVYAALGVWAGATDRGPRARHPARRGRGPGRRRRPVRRARPRHRGQRDRDRRSGPRPAGPLGRAAAPAAQGRARPRGDGGADRAADGVAAACSSRSAPTSVEGDGESKATPAGPSHTAYHRG